MRFSDTLCFGKDAQAAIARAFAGDAETKRDPKYRNKPCVIDNIKFASHAEGWRYLDLKALARAGKIHDLQIHQRYPLMVSGVLIGHYTDDFNYIENGERVIEDIKGGKATHTAASKLRIKLFEALFGCVVRIVK